MESHRKKHDAKTDSISSLEIHTECTRQTPLCPIQSFVAENPPTQKPKKDRTLEKKGAVSGKTRRKKTHSISPCEHTKKRQGGDWGRIPVETGQALGKCRRPLGEFRGILGTALGVRHPIRIHTWRLAIHSKLASKAKNGKKKKTWGGNKTCSVKKGL